MLDGHPPASKDIIVDIPTLRTEELKEGPIGFQSEGAEIHFKNIKIKTLD